MEVLPPPQTTSEVSAPTSREAYTRRSRPSSVAASASFQRDFIARSPYHSAKNVGAREARPPVRSSERPVLPDAVDLDAFAAGDRCHRLDGVHGRRRRRVEAVA